MSNKLRQIISCVCFGFILFGSSVFGENVTTVYFVPFEVETYVPISQETIISRAWEKWTISSESEASSLFALLDHDDDGKFDENRVRGLIHSDNQINFIDSNGIVLKDKSRFKIDKTQFVKFRESLRADQRQILKN